MTAGDGSPLELADYGEVFRRRWKIIVGGLLCGALLGALAVLIMPKSYTSTASVLVTSTGGDSSVQNGRTSSDLNLDTEAQIVTSNNVAAIAQARLKVTTGPRTLAKHVRVTVPPNTSVLDIAFSAPAPGLARSGADAFSVAYLENRKDLAEHGISTQIDTLQVKISGLNKELKDVGDRIANLGPSTARRAYETSQRDLLVQQIAALNAQLNPLTSGDINPGRVITDAQLPTGPSDPNIVVLGASALMIGLLLGLLLALGADRRDKRVRDRRDLTRAGLNPLVGHVAVPAVQDAGISAGRGQGSESLRQLRNALLAQMPVNGGSVLVADASSGISGSAVAVSLAVEIARSGSTVILVSANAEECAVMRAFSMPEHPGLGDVLAGRSEVAEALREVEAVRNLRVLTAGDEGPRFSDLLQSASAQQLYPQLNGMADYVIFDVAPMTLNADAQTLAATSSFVLLVTTALRTSRTEVSDAVDQLNHVSATMAGSIVVTVDPPGNDGLPPPIPPSSRLPKKEKQQEDVKAEASIQVHGEHRAAPRGVLSRRAPRNGADRMPDRADLTTPRSRRR